MEELAMVQKLKRLSFGTRRELLDVLQSTPEVRADLIGQFYAREETRELAELLMDLEQDELLRWIVVALLIQAQSSFA